MGKQPNRYVNLIASTLILICTGSIYAFSVFAAPVAEIRGWSLSEVSLAFTISTAISPIPMIIAGKLADKGYAREVMLFGGMFFGVSFILFSLATSLGMLYLGYGIVAGSGISFAYTGALGNATRYFPDKRGFATGMVTAGNGCAAIVIAPIASALILKFDVIVALRTLGIAFIIVSLVCGLLTKSAPNNYIPAGWTPPVVAKATNKAVDNSVNWQGMLSQPIFYLALAVFVAAALSGLLVAAHASTIGQNMFALTPATAALFVSLYALSNATGRFMWGAISDKIGRQNVLIVILCLVAAMLFILGRANGVTMFAIGLIGIGLTFGGVMGVFPSVTADLFGAKYMGVNYGIMFSGYGIAAFFGPRIGATIAENNGGDFTQAFNIALIICLVGLTLAILFKFVSKSSKGVNKVMNETA